MTARGSLGRFLSLFALLGAPVLHAHPLSLSTLHANVEEESIEVHLYVMVEDLVLFHELQSGPDFRIPRSSIEEAARTHAAQLLEEIQFRAEAGPPLANHLVGIDTSDLPVNGVHWDELKVHRIVFQFSFTLGDRPDVITLIQNLGGESPPVPSEMTVRLFHRGVLIDQAILSHGTTRSTVLDWDLDWDSLRRDPEQVREMLRQREDDRLGLPASTLVYAFLYLDETGARLELLIPLLVLDRWMDLTFEEEGRLSVHLQRRQRSAIAGQLANSFELTLDGKVEKARLERLQFHGPRPQDLAITAPETDVFRHSGRVALMFHFPSEEIPHAVSLEWKEFRGLPQLNASFYPFAERRQGVFLDPITSTLTWNSDKVRRFPPPLPRPPLDYSRSHSVPGTVLLALLLMLGVLWGLYRRRVRVRLAVPLLILLLVILPVSPKICLFPVTLWLPVTQAVSPSPDQIDRVFNSLLQNLYRAFMLQDEERVYDALAAEVEEPLIEPLYLQFLESLRMRDQGGAVARVNRIETRDTHLLSLSTRREPHLEVEAEWLVHGTVEHWGHLHRRTHRHRAHFTLRHGDDGWRIQDFQPLRTERVRMEIAIRR